MNYLCFITQCNHSYKKFRLQEDVFPAAFVHIIEICYKRGITVGTFADNIQNVRKWRDIRVKYISYSVHLGILYPFLFRNTFSKSKSYLFRLNYQVNTLC